ncbi:hypothetical protein [Phycobacter azelaicus]|uniref:hypothetical protein n=1 Tax=Phycobacter azelaicus TaxID=2668075 RepID=UPI0018693591|nr:hypothetical protein [Phycobacter azelaicus]
MPSTLHYKKNMLWVTLLTLGISTLTNSALASTDCYFRLSPRKYELSEVRSEIEYLESVIQGFEANERKYATEAVQFYLPRTRNAKSVIRDLAYTLNFVEMNPREGWGDELKYQLVRVFAEIQSRKFRVTNGVDGYPEDIRSYFLKNYETYRPLINRHLSTYHSAYFFAPCPSGTPYYFFYLIAALDRLKSQAPQVSVRDILKGAGFRRLEGARLFSRRFYHAGTERLPAIRIVAPPCNVNGTSPEVIDYEYDPTVQGWKKAGFTKSENLDIYQWFTEGFSDFGHHESVRWRVTTDSLYEAYQEKQFRRFRSLLQQQGIFAELPTILERECHNNDD